jgi:heme/copper-type cytochrome/quinol oxidase subunit 4
MNFFRCKKRFKHKHNIKKQKQHKTELLSYFVPFIFSIITKCDFRMLHRSQLDFCHLQELADL